jgi:hypothetical protein
LYDELYKMGSKLIWLLLIIVLVAIFSSLFKIKEDFRARARSSSTAVRASSARSTPNVTTGNSVRSTSKGNKNRSKNKSKKVKTKTTLKLKVDGDGDSTSKIAPANSLNIINGNVVVPNDTAIEFGGGVNGKEINAGKIRYGGWDDALNIVGAASDASNRTVRVWDKLRVGPLEIQADGCIGYGPGKKFTLCLQEDGNVVQYKDKKPVWATGIPS